MPKPSSLSAPVGRHRHRNQTDGIKLASLSRAAIKMVFIITYGQTTETKRMPRLDFSHCTMLVKDYRLLARKLFFSEKTFKIMHFRVARAFTWQLASIGLEEQEAKTSGADDDDEVPKFSATMHTIGAITVISLSSSARQLFKAEWTAENYAFCVIAWLMPSLSV